VAGGDRDQDEPDAVGISDLHFWFVPVCWCYVLVGGRPGYVQAAAHVSGPVSR